MVIRAGNANKRLLPHVRDHTGRAHHGKVRTTKWPEGLRIPSEPKVRAGTVTLAPRAKEETKEESKDRGHHPRNSFTWARWCILTADGAHFAIIILPSPVLQVFVVENVTEEEVEPPVCDRQSVDHPNGCKLDHALCVIPQGCRAQTNLRKPRLGTAQRERRRSRSEAETETAIWIDTAAVIQVPHRAISKSLGSSPFF